MGIQRRGGKTMHCDGQCKARGLSENREPTTGNVEGWGLNSPLDGEETNAGNIFYTAGRWTTSINNNPASARTEQCFVLFQPTKEIEVVVFVNSNVGSTGVSLTNIVRTAFINNIQEP